MNDTITVYAAAWVDGWNAGVAAARAVVAGSDLPVEFADRAISLLQPLLDEEK